MMLPRKIFPTVRLSPVQCATYEKLTDGVIAKALHEYDDFNHIRGRQLDRKHWKQIRKCDDITVFCERASYVPRADGSSFSGMSYSSGDSRCSSSQSQSAAVGCGGSSAQEYSDDEDDATEINPHVSSISASAVSSIASADVVSVSKKNRSALPKLLAVGRVAGKVEDLIYGLLSPTPTTSRMKEAYIHDEIADCRVLYVIKSATPDDPLRFLGLKWFIKAHSPIIGAVVRQRDLVFIESIGMRTREDGSRFGYMVMHSVEVPECRELDEYSIVRSRVSLVYILTQSGSGHVDVFMKMYVEMNGSLPDSLAMRTLANSVKSIALCQIGGHKRKMGWEATKKLRNPQRGPLLVYGEPNCSNCRKSLSWMTSSATCFFCSTRVCSKCYEQHELAIPNSPISLKLITMTSVTACTRCYATVFRNMEAEDVAREEVLAGEYGVVPADYGKPKPAPVMSARSLNFSEFQSLAISERQLAYGTRTGRWEPASSLDEQHGDEVVEVNMGDFVRDRYQGAAVQPHRMPVQELPPSEYPLDHSTTVSYYSVSSSQAMGEGRSNATPSGYGGAPPAPQSNEDMYARIAKLNRTAENVYQYTKRTTDNALGQDVVLVSRS